MTLIELLVVISIMLLLAVVAIPAMRPALSTRQTREAARSINVYLGAARNRAVETGRPVGVEIVRDPNLTLAGTTLYQVEIPPPYGGDTEDTRVTVTLLSFSGGIATVQATRASGIFSGGLIRLGDQVQFNQQGWVYTITGANVDANNYVRSSPPAGTDPDGFPLTLQASVPGSFVMPTLTAVPFQISRRPTRSSTSPLRLPSSVVVDLEFSGTEATNFTASTADVNSVTILFAPSGNIYRVVSDEVTGRVIDPIYLLVGKRERLPLAYGEAFQAEDGVSNLNDLTNLWVTVNSRSGLIVSAEMAEAAVGDIQAARLFARQKQAMGGR